MLESNLYIFIKVALAFAIRVITIVTVLLQILIKGFRFNLVRLRCPEKNELIPFVIKFTRKNCFLITFISGKEILTALRIPVFKKPDIGLLKWQRVPNKVFATLNFDHGLFTRFVEIFIRSQPQLLGIYHIR